MSDFEHSNAYRQIIEYFKGLDERPIRIRETQQPALESIMSSPHFKSITKAFKVIEDYEGQHLQTAEKNYIKLKLAQIQSKREQDMILKEKMQESIDKLEQIIFSIDQYHSTIMQKHEWLQKQITKYQQSLPQIQEQIQILQSRRKKQKKSQKQQKTIKTNTSQLSDILKYFRCTDKPFPKNKTQTLMLINRIQSMIQQLQMNKMQSYMIS